MAFIGKDVPAQNSPALVAGAGLYTGDVKLDHMAYAHIVRSPFAAARILSIDASAALALPGVICVVTGEDLKARDYAMPVEGFGEGASMKPFELYPLAVGHIRYAGESVAAVVADSPYTAKQAAMLVDVDYEERDPVVDPARGLEPDSPLVEEGWGSNVLFQTRMQSGNMEEVLRNAARKVGGELHHHRYTGAAMEPRAYVADWDAHRQTLKFWASTQCPHPMRTQLAETLHLAENSIQVIQPNVGGAFGLKIPAFQEEALTAALSIISGRPVRWVAERREDLLAGGHAREGKFTWEAAYEADGLVTALKVRYVADVGAPSGLAGWGQSYVTGFAIPTVYKIRDTDVEVIAVATNKCPWNAYRGFGKESSSGCTRLGQDLVLAVPIVTDRGCAYERLWRALDLCEGLCKKTGRVDSAVPDQRLLSGRPPGIGDILSRKVDHDVKPLKPPCVYLLMCRIPEDLVR